MRAAVFRKSGVPVAAPRQLVPVAGAGAAGPQGVHGADQHRAVLVRANRGAVPGHGEHPVHMLCADGPEYRVRHRPVHIVQRRGVRAQAQGLADVRPERVLLRRHLLRIHRVRHHRELEKVTDLQHHVPLDQRRGTITGEYARKHIARIIII